MTNHVETKEEMETMSDEQLHQGLEVLSEMAAEASNERIMFGDSGPGTQSAVSAYARYEAEYQRRYRLRIEEAELIAGGKFPELDHEDEIPF